MEAIKRFGTLIKKAKQKKYVRIPATAVFWLAPAFFLLMIESFNSYPLYYFNEFLQKRAQVALFGLILFYLMFAAVFFLVKKPWICLIVFGAFAVSFSLVNYIKFSLTGENFFPHDFIMAANMGELAGFVSVEFSWWAPVFFAGTVLYAAVIGVFAYEAPFKIYVRAPVFTVICVAVVLFFNNGAFAEKIFNKFGMLYETASQQDWNYKHNGFVGAFSINIASFGISKPDGYSERILEEALGGYSASPPSADFSYPDIAVILSESFWDMRLLPGSELSSDPLENFDKLAARENAYSGKLLVPAIGGGTIRTEFEILTGFTCDAFPSGVVPYNIIGKPMQSYVSHYKDAGYTAVAIHPYRQKFYSRNRTLPLLGFDEYYGIETLSQISDITQIKRGGYISDETFAEYVNHFFNEYEKSGKPLFLFGITMENHQQYGDKYKSFDISVKNPNLNERDLNNLQNYTQGLKNADEALSRLIGYIDGRARPTVLVYFGDHLPSITDMGTLAAYVDSGFVHAPTYSAEARKKLYATPFVIYANYPLNSEAVDFDINGGYFAAYDLLNIVSDLTGSGKSRYMAYLDALREVLPYYNRRLEIRNLTEEQEKMLKIQYFATYNAIKK